MQPPAWSCLAVALLLPTASSEPLRGHRPESHAFWDGTPQLRVPPREEDGSKGTQSQLPADSGLGGTFPVPHTDEQASRPFVWLPLNGKRHAIERDDRQVEVGEAMRCLCGAVHPRAVVGDMEWLMWKTCESCREEACRIVEKRNKK